jgi:hypothetical protein
VNRHLKPLWDGLTSLKLTLVLFSALMVLIVACTLAQVHLGTWGAVDVYIRAWFVWTRIPGTDWEIAMFPGGALVGLLLAVNLLLAQIRRIELSWKKVGLWIAHAGLILLVAGEFVTGLFQVETNMAIEEGQTVDFVESPRELELAVVDVTDPAHDDVYGVPARLLGRGGPIAIPGTPLTLNVKRFFPNADLLRREPTHPPTPVTQGIGTGVTVVPRPPVARDDMINHAVAYVEPVGGGQAHGTWLVSNGLGQPQAFQHDGRTYLLQMRARRYYLPYALTLKDFKHDVYPGTDIPKNFSSLVHLVNPAKGEARDVLIYMNQPLRYDGKAFYQSSFGKNDTLSILQVVDNPGWLLPYISCTLVMIGLIVHFALSLRRGVRRASRAAPASSPARGQEAA